MGAHPDMSHATRKHAPGSGRTYLSSGERADNRGKVGRIVTARQCAQNRLQLQQRRGAYRGRRQQNTQHNDAEFAPGKALCELRQRCA
eukprot:381619-Rhodomonas_salina.2